MEVVQENSLGTTQTISIYADNPLICVRVNYIVKIVVEIDIIYSA